MTIEWTTSGGLAQRRPVALPGADRLLVADIVNYVFEQRLCGPSRLKVPASATGSRRSRCQAAWLACTDKICVPEQGEVSLDVATGWSQRARSALRRVAAGPAAAAGQRRRISRLKATRFELAIPLPASVEHRRALFLPRRGRRRSIMPRRNRSAQGRYADRRTEAPPRRAGRADRACWRSATGGGWRFAPCPAR